VTSETEADSRSAIIAEEAEQSSVTDAVWSEPILFYPDGTATSARLVLKNEHGRSIELTLRGLTGVVSIGTVQSSEEALQ
jgi:hypothetical protein